MKSRAGLAVVAAALVLAPAAAEAQERVTDAVLGGLAGALVMGPVGLAVGGVIGYSAGPQIACGIGVKRCYGHGRYRHAARAHRDADAAPRRDRRDSFH
jgi:hypothetical protein